MNNDISEIGTRRQWLIPSFDYNYGLKCIFTGCYELPSGEAFLLETTSCYIGLQHIKCQDPFGGFARLDEKTWVVSEIIATFCRLAFILTVLSIMSTIIIIVDFNERHNDMNDCDKNATCTNNEEGTYTCECNDGYVGSGMDCEKGNYY